MSSQMRQYVCDNLLFSRDSDRADLMDDGGAGAELDTHGTSSQLISFLEELLGQRGGVWKRRLLVTAVRSDHPSPDGPNGHAGGNAIDFSEPGVDDAIVHLVQDVQRCPAALGIGLGGPFQAAAAACGGYDEGSKLFEDNSTDHIHVQVKGY